MSDSLIISNLELRTHIGVPDEERLEEQTIEVTIEIFLDTKEAGKDDDVSKSIDYQLAVNDVKDLAKTERKTIEKLAEDIADMIINKFKPDQVKVTVLKRIIPDTESTSLTITRP